jgi:hypothetical protein
MATMPPIEKAQQPDAVDAFCPHKIHRAQHVLPFQVAEGAHAFVAATVGAKVKHQHVEPGSVQGRDVLHIRIHAAAVPVEENHRAV